MTSPEPPVLCLAGPTASGKSAASYAIAKVLPIEIINVDSATIYRGMDIGTAKPDSQAQREIPHHLLDILDPAESYSAAQFRTDAMACIQEIRARGHVPLLVGGTMLYFKVLREGIDALPQGDEQWRARLQARAAEHGWPALHAELARVDPETAARLAPNDSQRIGRALEVYEVTGQALSSLFRQPDQRTDKGIPTVLISLEPSDRQALHARIENRFDEMLATGFVEEVRRLHARGDLHTGLPSIRCVGYRQLWDFVQGDCSLELAREKAIAATRQLAKRQLTWLRSMTDRQVVDCLAPDAINQVLQRVKSAPNGQTTTV
jgi:tRNA dimethylallyltransferase